MPRHFILIMSLLTMAVLVVQLFSDETLVIRDEPAGAKTLRIQAWRTLVTALRFLVIGAGCEVVGGPGLFDVDGSHGRLAELLMRGAFGVTFLAGLLLLLKSASLLLAAGAQLAEANRLAREPRS